MSIQIIEVLCIIAIMSICFFTEIIPLAFTALLVPVMLQALGILTPAQAWAGFSNTTIITWMGLFIVGAMFAKTSVTYQIKRLVLKYSKGSGLRVLLIIILSALVLGLVTSATSSIAVLAPIISEICRDSGIDQKRAFKPVADVGTWASVMTFPIGSTFTYIMLANSYLEAAGTPLRYGLFDFTLMRVPMLIVLIGYYLFINRKLKANTITASNDMKKIDEDRGTTYTPKQEKLAVALFIANLVLMIFVSFTNLLPPYIVSTFFAILAVALRLMKEKEALSSISWSTIFLVAGTLPLATAINSTGTGTWIAELVQKAFPSAINPVVLAAVLCVIATICTQFMSNSAVWAVFGPIAASMAISYGMDPRLIMAGVMNGAIICFATPMATTACAYAYGYCNYNMKEFIKDGWLPCLLLVVVFMIWGPISLNLLYG